MTSNAHHEWLDDILRRIPAARVTVFGDFCLDAYWQLDDGKAELSVETGLPVRRVREQRYSLGGAGNVVANLAALGVGSVRAVGLTGDDPFGHCLRDLLMGLEVDVSGMLTCQADWQTFVYAKPHIGAEEQNRIDFGGFNRISPESMGRLAEQLARAAEASDVVVLNQQIPTGISVAAMIALINQVIADHSNCTFIVDSRHRGELYRSAILKVNDHEAARLCGRQHEGSELQPELDYRTDAEQLARRFSTPLFITCGGSGIVVAHAGGVEVVAGTEVDDPIDPVGAGDTVVAALAAAIAVGADALTAAKLANRAASVTVRKMGTTGTASPAEIHALCADSQ